MAGELSIVAPIILISFAFAYLSINLKEESSVLKIFFFLLALLFPVFSIFTSLQLALSNGYESVGSYMSYIGLGSFFIFFFILLYFGIVVYMSEAFRVSVLGEEDGNYEV